MDIQDSRIVARKTGGVPYLNQTPAPPSSGITEYNLNPLDQYTCSLDPFASEVQDIVLREPQCKLLSDFEKGCLIQKILNDAALCLWFPASSQLPFSPTIRSVTTGSPQGAAESCWQAVANNRRIQEIVNDRCEKNVPPPSSEQPGEPSPDRSSPDDSSVWPTILKSGIPTATAILYIIRFIRIMREVGKEMEEAGKVTGILAKALGALNREGRALMDAIDGSLENIRHFFGTTLVNVGQTIKYVFAGEWFRKKDKKQAEEKKAAQPDKPPTIKRRRLWTYTGLSSVSEQTDPIWGKPERSVVESQLTELRNDPEYKSEALVFAQLDRELQLYLAELAINKWHMLLAKGDAVAEGEKSATELKQADSLPTYGKLPADYIKLFASKHLQQHLIGQLRASSRAWIKTEKVRMAGLITPTMDMVKGQLTSDPHFKSESEARYAAGLAIEWWNHLDIKERANFILDITNLPMPGQLPQQALRTFRPKKLDLVLMRKRAPVFDQLLGLKPEFKRHGFFAIVNTRVIQLLAAWEGLPASIQKVFGERNAEKHLPLAFVELMRSSLRIGTIPREKIAPAEKPWEYNPQTEVKTSEGFNLSLIMKLFAKENPDLALYPQLLEIRAKTLIDDWANLPLSIQEAFKAQDRINGAVGSMEIGIPVTYIRLWQRINAGIGISERPSLEEDTIPKEPRGGGGSGGASGGGAIGGFTLSSGAQSPQISSMAPHGSNNVSYIMKPQDSVVVGGQSVYNSSFPVISAPWSAMRLLPLAPAMTGL